MIFLTRGLILPPQNIRNFAGAVTKGVRKVSSIGDDVLSASRAAKPHSDPALENLRLRRQVK